MLRIIIGVMGVASTYAYRPPSGVIEALGMLLQGREFYLTEPMFLGLMAVFVIVTLSGVVALIRGGGSEGRRGE